MVELQGGEVVRVLKRALEGVPGLRLAYLFGSLTRGEKARDVDLAILADEGQELHVVSEVVRRVSRALGIPEEKVDVVNLRRTDLPLAYRVITEGVKLMDRGGASLELVREVALAYPSVREELRLAARLWLEEDPEIDEELLLRRLDEVLRDATLLRRHVDKGLEWLLSDIERTYAFERALHRALEAMLGICRHVVAARGLGAVAFYSDYPVRLAESGLMSRELAEKLSELARLRNVLVHRYVELVIELLMQAARELVEHVMPSFSAWVRSLLRESR